MTEFYYRPYPESDNLTVTGPFPNEDVMWAWVEWAGFTDRSRDAVVTEFRHAPRPTTVYPVQLVNRSTGDVFPRAGEIDGTAPSPASPHEDRSDPSEVFVIVKQHPGGLAVHGPYTYTVAQDEARKREGYHVVKQTPAPEVASADEA